MTLVTERLMLRPPRPDDAPELVRLIQGAPDIAAYTMNIPAHYTLDTAHDFIERVRHNNPAESGAYNFVMVRMVDEALIGGAGMRYEARHTRAEVGYWLGADYRGQGYATEGLRRLMQFAFDDLDAGRVYANYFIENPASRRVMERAGMVYEGTLRGHVLKDGVRHDLGYCGLLRVEWEAGQQTGHKESDNS